MKEPSSFITYTDLCELGRGAQLTLLGFRAFAFGGTKCCCLVKTYQQLLGPEEGGFALSQLRKVALHLGNDGKRRLKLAAPGCIRITHDEGSILGALSALQDGNTDLCEGHLTWLLTQSPASDLVEACSEFVGALTLGGLVVSTPESVKAAKATAEYQTAEHETVLRSFQ